MFTPGEIKNVLVVGGAGYIGSHCVRQLVLAGYRPVVLDNMVFGHPQAVAEDVTVYDADLGDMSAAEKILRDEEIHAVMHFAAFAYVGESVTDPLKYYFNNVSKTLYLLQAMRNVGCGRFVFSSTCATYGVPEKLPMTEETPQAPINPYGQTKLDIENVLKAMASAYGLSFVALRYFNASGAAEDGSIGEDHDPETHLIPLILDVALGKRENIKIFGTDYPTPDGTALRDYVHVDDLSRAHIAAFKLLDKPGQQHFFNLGTGKPFSVREVIDSARKITGHAIPAVETDRRAGDPPSLYADNKKALAELDWKIQFNDVDSIIETAWRWHKSHPNGYEG